jgi:hypothetical protein
MTKLALKECVLLFAAGIVASFAMVALLGAWALLDTSFVRLALSLGLGPHSAIRVVGVTSMPVFAVFASGALVFLIRLRYGTAIVPACVIFATGLLVGALGMTLLEPVDAAAAHFMAMFWGSVVLVFATCTAWFALKRHA